MMTHSLTTSPLRGIFIDLEGVLHIGTQMIEGADEVLQQLRKKGFILRFLTNTSTQSRANLQQKLTQIGLNIELYEILNTPRATARYLQQQQLARYRLILSPETQPDFLAYPSQILSNDEPLQAIVIGDTPELWTHEVLTTIFTRLMNDNCELITLHKNKFWQTSDGLKLDIGALIAGLEYASGKTATVIGKPSATFFTVALNDAQLTANEVIMIGDDIDSDIGGCQNCGITGVLVKTGKYRAEYAEKSSIKPHLVIDSIKNILDYLI